MVQLVTGYNRIVWTAPTQMIATVPWLALIQVVYCANYLTGVGTLSYQPSDALSNMSRFVQGIDYLVVVKAAYNLDEANQSASGTYPDYPGYVAPTANTAPTSAIGRTETGVAAEPIIGGRLVAQTTQGLRHYSSAEPAHMNLSFGIALNSALAGGSVSVRRPGYVHFENWGLPTNTPLLAGADGRLVTSVLATSFYHLIGRSLDSESLVFQPESIIILSTPQLLT